MRKRVRLLLLILVLPLFFLSCGRSGPSNETEVKRTIKTSKVAVQEVQSYIEATGSVQPDLEGSSKIMSHLPGIVGQISVKVGDRVHRGDPLLVVKSPDAADTYSSYLSTLAQFRQAERIYNLNKQLFEIGAVTKNDLLNSESTYEQMQAVSEGLKRKLTLYGCFTDMAAHGGKPSCTDTVTIRASINGFVADIQAHVGDKVDAATPLMTIADPGNIVVVANIYDTDVPKIKKGSNVIFFVDTFPNTAFKGSVTYVSDVSDTDSKTVKAFIRILDRKDLFKQNMFLKLKIEDQKRLLPLIPQSAMVYKEGKFYVYIPAKEGKNQLREVKPIQEAPGKMMAVEGIEGGEEIVTTAIELERP